MPHDDFYISPAWRAARSGFLSGGRLCAVPGCGKRATHVDHIVPRRAGGAAFNLANLQAMCHSHHSQKTAKWDGGYGRAAGSPGRQFAQGCDIAGNPIDPGHHWKTPLS